MIKEYHILVIREAGNDPLTSEFYPQATEEFTVEATSRRTAFDLAQILFTLKARGQFMHFYINNEPYFDENY